MLKMTDIQLELNPDILIYLFIEKKECENAFLTLPKVLIK